MDALLGEQLLLQELVLELGLAGGRFVAAVRVDSVRHGYLSM
jgi:hypothetical protein